MPTKCLSLVRGRRIRLTRLDGCGRPVYGESSTVVSKGFITVSFTANTTESDEINVTNAAGEVCVFEPAITTLTGYAVEIQFCEVDPELLALVTGQNVYVDAFGNVVGFTVNTKIQLEDSGFGLELWAGAAGGDACSTDGAEGNYGYLLLPYLKGGILGDFTVENGNVTFTVTGANTRDGNNWGVGPYPDVMLTSGSLPGPLVTALDGDDHLLLTQTGIAPPAATCGTRPLLDPESTAITAIAGVEGATDMEADFTTTPAASDPVYYEFGDGTWDYVVAPGDATHVYATAGTYTVRASTNGEWVETTVTVPFP
jgi:hypothetical protein